MDIDNHCYLLRNTGSKSRVTLSKYECSKRKRGDTSSSLATRNGNYCQPLCYAVWTNSHCVTCVSCFVCRIYHGFRLQHRRTLVVMDTEFYVCIHSIRIVACDYTQN